MDAVRAQLVRRISRVILLLSPPFDRTELDPGYIKGYVPGVRENGGQYTHAAQWVVLALARLGSGDEAAELFHMLNPINHTRTAGAVGVYKTEPYAIAGDVYDHPAHRGRGGWTWYTGSAGWMYRVALESVLGVTLEGGDTIRVRPRIPDGWAEYTVRLRLPDGRTRYEIRVVNPEGKAHEVVACERGVVEDGAARIAAAADGNVHRVVVTLGRFGTAAER